MSFFPKIFSQSSFKYELFIILSFLFFTLVGCEGSCSKYKRTQLIEGMYYPNGTVRLEGRSVKDESRIFEITISHPFRVSELGILTPGWYEEPWRNTHQSFEVGRSEIFKNKAYYVPLYELNSTGLFEYYERSITLKEWIRDHPIITVLLAIVVLIVVVVLLFKKISLTSTTEYSLSSYSSSSYSDTENSESSYTNNEEEKAKEKRIIGHAGYGKRVNPKTGVIQEEGLLGWVDTDKRIDPETGNYQKEGLIDWNDTETRIDQESGIIQKEGLIDYIDTDTRINPETGIIQKEGLLGWVDTDKRINPETGKSQHEGLLGWVDD